MHEHYDGYEDEYNDDDYDYDYSKDPYQWYYKFDIGPNTPISDWLSDMLNKWIGPNAFKDLDNIFEIINIPGFSSQKFPVNSWNPSTAKSNSFQYLGSNYQGSPIWKAKYFISNKLNSDYINHLQSHAVHFVQQPAYYKGMFDILN